MIATEYQIEAGSPDWFESATDGKGFGYESGLDHARQFGDIALFATYPRECEGLLPVLNFCRAVGLVVHVGGRSFYAPGTTLVAIYRREDEEQFRNFQDGNTRYEEA